MSEFVKVGQRIPATVQARKGDLVYKVEMVLVCTSTYEDRPGGEFTMEWVKIGDKPMYQIKRCSNCGHEMTFDPGLVLSEEVLCARCDSDRLWRTRLLNQSCRQDIPESERQDAERRLDELA